MTEVTTRRTYTPAERRQAMEIYASQNGRKDLVEKMLADADMEISVNTIRDWATNRHRDEYMAIRQELDTYIRTHAADRYRAIASSAADVVDEGLRQTHEALKRGELTLREIPKAVQQAMVSAGIATDKGELLSGNPTAIVGGSGSVDELTRELASVGITIVVPGQPVDRKPAIDVQATEREPELAALPEHVDQQ